ncbi:MAG: hypothetical protein ACTSU4_15140 [Promethearchaeota archaeon]
MNKNWKEVTRPMIKEISLFLPNYPGMLSQLVKLLRANDINLIAISVAQAKDYGLVMIIVDKPSECIDLLEENNYELSVKEVIAVKMSASAEIINDIAELMGTNNVNIEYMYSTLLKSRKNEAFIILHTDNNQKAFLLLKEKGLFPLESI